jgi:hypothetical protein
MGVHAKMMDVTRSAHGEVVIRISGTFDAKAASRLAGWLVEVTLEEPLVVDFSQVRVCEDFGLASVAPGLAGRDRLIVRGLSRHQERMLKYFGVELPRTPEPFSADAETLGGWVRAEPTAARAR